MKRFVSGVVAIAALASLISAGEAAAQVRIRRGGPFAP